MTSPQEPGPAQQYPPAAGAPAGPPAADQPRQRPGTVLASAIMTFIGGGLMVLAGLVFVSASGSDAVDDALADSGLGSVSSGVIAGTGTVVALVGIAVITLAAFALRGSNGARIGLTVIGGVFVLLQAISVFALGAGAGAAIGVVWVAIAVSLLWRPDAKAWFAGTQR